MKLRRDAGFTLIEFVFAILIAATVGAIAVPALFRVRAAAAEASAIGSLRAIHGAEVGYATACGAGFYAPSIDVLATPASASQPPFIGPEFTSNVTTRQTYRIRFNAGAVATDSKASCNGLAAGQAVSSFYLSADPLDATTGRASRYLGVNQSGLVYQSTKHIAAFYGGVPPAPAEPLK